MPATLEKHAVHRAWCQIADLPMLRDFSRMLAAEIHKPASKIGPKSRLIELLAITEDAIERRDE